MITNQAMAARAVSRPLQQYDDELALVTADHAIAAYKQPEVYVSMMRDAGWPRASLLERGATQAGIAWSREVTIVAVRGSSELDDWRHNLRSVRRVAWPGMLPAGATIGRGFRDQAQAVVRDVGPMLDRLDRIGGTQHLVLTGHSLGAAVAPLLAVLLLSKGCRVPNVVYLHEGPRIGNVEWSIYYSKLFDGEHCSTWSVVNVRNGETDLVTRVPKRGWGFRHVGRRVIHVGGEVLLGDEMWQAYRRRQPVTTWRALRVITRLRRSIEAHLGSELLETLRARVAQRGGGSCSTLS